MYATALRESNRLSKRINTVLGEIDKTIVKTYAVHGQGFAPLNRTKSGILLTERNSWVLGFVGRKPGLVQFVTVFQSLCLEIAESRQSTLVMMGLRSLYDLYEKQLSTLFYAPDTSVERGLARYYFLSAIVTNAPEAKKMAGYIKSTYSKDKVIQEFNMADYGRSDFIDLASRRLATAAFDGEFVQYANADRELMTHLVLLLHGYVHTNPFAFRTARLRNDPLNNLLSLKELKLAGLLTVKYEVLWGLSNYVPIPVSMKVFNNSQQVIKAYRAALGSRVAEMGAMSQ